MARYFLRFNYVEGCARKRHQHCCMKVPLMAFCCRVSGNGPSEFCPWRNRQTASWGLVTCLLVFSMGAEKGQRDRHAGHIIPELAEGFLVLRGILVPMPPEVLLAEDSWGVGEAWPASPPHPMCSAWGWAVPAWKPPQKGSSCAQREAINLTQSWGGKDDNTWENSSLDAVFCLLPLLLMALDGHADAHHFQAATARRGKPVRATMRLRKLSELSPLISPGFLGQMIKYYSSQHRHDGQSGWQGQGREELVPYSVRFITLVLQVPFLQLWRQALCQSFNQAGICPNLYWLVRPLHFLLCLSSALQLWNSIYEKQECKKAWKPKLIRCCQVGALRHIMSNGFIFLILLKMLFGLNLKCRSS